MKLINYFCDVCGDQMISDHFHTLDYSLPPTWSPPYLRSFTYQICSLVCLGKMVEKLEKEKACILTGKVL